MPSQNGNAGHVPIGQPKTPPQRAFAPASEPADLLPWQVEALQRLTAVEPIVVNDDDHMSRIFYRALLHQQFGLTILDTYDPVHALEICQTQPISLLISCFMKPTPMDGFALAEQLKTNRATRHIPLLFITGSAQVREMAVRAGANAFLAKPCHPNDILQQIWLLLRERSL